MSTGSKNKNLLVIIAVLLLTNIAVLGYFLWYKKPDKNFHGGRDKNGIGEMLKNDVGFDTTQLASYKEMRENQKKILRPMFDEMRKSKDSLFKMIGKSGPEDSLVQVLTDAIAQKQKALDMQTFRYFSQIRQLCKPGQEIKYDSLVISMFSKMGKPKVEPDKNDKKK